jgi:hypothetical protein
MDNTKDDPKTIVKDLTRGTIALSFSLQIHWQNQNLLQVACKKIILIFNVSTIYKFKKNVDFADWYTLK